MDTGKFHLGISPLLPKSCSSKVIDSCMFSIQLIKLNLDFLYFNLTGSQEQFY